MTRPPKPPVIVRAGARTVYVHNTSPGDVRRALLHAHREGRDRVTLSGRHVPVAGVRAIHYRGQALPLDLDPGT